MTPICIYSGNLSAAWSRAYLHALSHRSKVLPPLIISINTAGQSGAPTEDQAVRENLDRVLFERDAVSVEDTACTVFPQRLWSTSRGDRKRLFQLHRNGANPVDGESSPGPSDQSHCFERLVNFGDAAASVNQLESILSSYERDPFVRSSTFHAGIFDPARDQAHAGSNRFPSVQHVTFLPAGNDLAVNAFYVRQQFPFRAYGDLLGLARLGAFMAAEMKLRLGQLNVITGTEKLEGLPRPCRGLTALTAAARACIAANEPQRGGYDYDASGGFGSWGPARHRDAW